jgi:hypothetical protein
MFFLADMLNKKLHLPRESEALPGRAKAIATAARHAVLKHPLKSEPPAGFETIYFGMGCFLGCRAPVLADAGRLADRGRLSGRHDAEPDLSGNLHRADRPHRSGQGDL